MSFAVASFIFLLAILAIAVSLVVLGISFFVHSISRRTTVYALSASFAVAVVSVIVAAVATPDQAKVTSAAHNQTRAKPRANARAVALKQSDRSDQPYRGEDRAVLTKRYHLSAADTDAVERVQQKCYDARVHDGEARAAKPSMGVALQLERASGEWVACDMMMRHTISVIPALRRLSDYDDVALFGTIPSDPLLQESGAYGSAGAEWQMFGQQARGCQDIRNAYNVGREMVARGYADEGRAVMGDYAGALNDTCQ